ncbi:calpain-like cysteine peptidase [Diplonema papillatum]|nr:calpain-like cysteine peptidase [Diplonema papillatum]|eukprot:gene1417-2180_t
MASAGCSLVKRRVSHLPSFNPYAWQQPGGAAEAVPRVPRPPLAALVDVEGKTPLEVYAESCEAHACRRNTALLKFLARGEPVSDLDLSLNFVGRVGLRPVLDVARSCSVRSLNLSNNFLDNGSMLPLCAAMDGVTSLARLDLSNNPISQSGGKCLYSLVRNNCNLVEVCLQRTLINPALQQAVQQRAEANRLLTPEDRERVLSQQAALRWNFDAQRSKRQQKQSLRDAATTPTSSAVDPIDALHTLADDQDPEFSSCPALHLMLQVAG